MAVVAAAAEAEQEPVQGQVAEEPEAAQAGEPVQVAAGVEQEVVPEPEARQAAWGVSAPAPGPRLVLVRMRPSVLARMLQSVRVQVLRQPQGLNLASRPEKVKLSAMAPAMGPVTRGLGPKTELVSDQGPEPAAL